MDKQRLEIYVKESIDKIYDRILGWHYPTSLYSGKFKDVIKEIIIDAFDDSREDIDTSKLAIAEMIEDSLPIPYNTIARIENGIALIIDKNFDFFAKFLIKKGVFQK